MAQLKATTINGDLSVSGDITSKLNGGDDYYVAYKNYAAQTGDFYATTFHATSDRNLKENIVPSNIDYNSVLNSLKIYEYNFKDDAEKTKQIGIMAQDLRDALPEDLRPAFISGDEEKNHLSINESKIQYLLLMKIRELEARIIELEKKEK